jgi:hypothetical protein
MACGFLWAPGAITHSSEMVRQALINPQGIVWRTFSRQIPVPWLAVCCTNGDFFSTFSHFPTHRAALEYNDNHSH